MAKEVTQDALEKKRIREEKQKLKKTEKEQRKEVKKRARELAEQEEELDGGGNGLVTFAATLVIILLWIAVVCVIVKLDIGGFGSSVLTPMLKDVPVVNKILPNTTTTITDSGNSDSYGGYNNLAEAVEYIKQLEVELEQVRLGSSTKDADIEKLIAENKRLSEFEERQVEFQRIRTEFYEEVVYAENGPGEEAYTKWFESMNPETAEYLYKQVVIQQEASKQVQDYALAYAEMKPKEAAKIFDAMTDDFDLVAKILNCMTAEDRGNILAQMNASNAAKLTKIMNPDS